MWIQSAKKKLLLNITVWKKCYKIALCVRCANVTRGWWSKVVLQLFFVLFHGVSGCGECGKRAHITHRLISSSVLVWSLPHPPLAAWAGFWSSLSTTGSRCLPKVFTLQAIFRTPPPPLTRQKFSFWDFAQINENWSVCFCSTGTGELIGKNDVRVCGEVFLVMLWEPCGGGAQSTRLWWLEFSFFRSKNSYSHQHRHRHNHTSTYHRNHQHRPHLSQRIPTFKNTRAYLHG
jgi:hypothetical protein